MFRGEKIGIILDAKLAEIRGLCLLNEEELSFIGCDLLVGLLLTRKALVYDYIRSGSTSRDRKGLQCLPRLS